MARSARIQRQGEDALRRRASQRALLRLVGRGVLRYRWLVAAAFVAAAFEAVFTPAPFVPVKPLFDTVVGGGAAVAAEPLGPALPVDGGAPIGPPMPDEAPSWTSVLEQSFTEWFAALAVEIRELLGVEFGTASAAKSVVL